MPVDVRDGTVMRLENVFNRRLSTQPQVPYKPGEKSISCIRLGLNTLAISHWMSKQCIEHGSDEDSTEHPPHPMCHPEEGTLVFSKGSRGQ